MNARHELCVSAAEGPAEGRGSKPTAREEQDR